MDPGPDYLPIGTRVRIASGPFQGMTGDVISFAEAERLRGDAGPPSPNDPGWVRVVIEIFGKQMPVSLEGRNVEAIE